MLPPGQKSRDDCRLFSVRNAPWRTPVVIEHQQRNIVGCIRGVHKRQVTAIENYPIFVFANSEYRMLLRSQFHLHDD